jgi:hypothetical protein
MLNSCTGTQFLAEAHRHGRIVSMDIAPAFSIASSGLGYESLRMAVGANNIANLNTSDFTASRVVGQPVAGGGVIGVVQATDRAPELIQEILTQMTASIGYRANASVIRGTDRALGWLLDAVV